ncbi:hypothetical protein Z043-117858, partial [Arapaima gigas]
SLRKSHRKESGEDPWKGPVSRTRGRAVKNTRQLYMSVATVSVATKGHFGSASKWPRCMLGNSTRCSLCGCRAYRRMRVKGISGPSQRLHCVPCLLCFHTPTLCWFACIAGQVSMEGGGGG